MRGRAALALLVLLLQAARGRAPGAAGSATPQGSGSCRLARLVGVRRAPNEASCGGLRLRLRGGAFDTVSPYSVAELRAIANVSFPRRARACTRACPGAGRMRLSCAWARGWGGALLTRAHARARPRACVPVFPCCRRPTRTPTLLTTPPCSGPLPRTRTWTRTT